MNFKAAISLLGCIAVVGSVHAAFQRTNSAASAENPSAPTPPKAAKSDKTAKPALPTIAPIASTNAAPTINPNAAPDEASTSPSAAFANASAGDANPYAVIIDRNVFHLNPPPPPPDPTNNQPPPNIKITGIMKTDKGYQALFAIPPKDAKEATEYLCLSENEKSGVIELVKIFPDKEECDVVNAGVRMTLSFKNNSYNPPAKPGGAPGAPGAPGQPPMPPPAPPVAVANPAPQQQVNSGGVVVAGSQTSTGTSGNGVIVAGGFSGTPSAQGAQPAGQPQDNAGLRQIPTRTLRLTPQEQSLVMQATYATGGQQNPNTGGIPVDPRVVNHTQKGRGPFELPPPIPDFDPRR